MHKAPAASILIAGFNCEGYIARAIQSGLDQTQDDIEIVVVDDGSRDGTWRAIAAMAEADSRVVPVRHEKNLGPSAARNSGLDKAAGRWIAVLDADDRFCPERLAKLIGAAETCGCDLLGDNLQLEAFETGEHLGLAMPDAWMQIGAVSMRAMVQRDQFPHGARMEFGYLKPIIRRAFLARHGIRYHDDISIGEDFLLYAECLLARAKFHVVPEAYYVYSVRPKSLSSHPGALMQLGAGNRRIRASVDPDDRETLALLTSRQNLIDFAALHVAALNLRWGAFARSLRCISKPYLMRRVAIAAHARLHSRPRAGRAKPEIAS